MRIATSRHKPPNTKIVHRAYAAAASTLRVEGYGAASRIHTSRILPRPTDRPLVLTGGAEDKARSVPPHAT